MSFVKVTFGGGADCPATPIDSEKTAVPAATAPDARTFSEAITVHLEKSTPAV
jgi:hypothetical protein